jgi:hypothetical protein
MWAWRAFIQTGRKPTASHRVLMTTSTPLPTGPLELGDRSGRPSTARVLKACGLASNAG